MRMVMVALVLVAASCATTAQVMSVPGTGMRAKSLERDEYVVLGDAEGKACVEETCVIGICSSKSDTGSETKLEGRLNTTRIQTEAPVFYIPGFSEQRGTEGNAADAEQAALYKAIESQPEADALMAPRKSAEVTTTGFWFGHEQRACVRVFGKGIRLKTDAEIAAASSAGGAP